jgi:hypothetical protein
MTNNRADSGARVPIAIGLPSGAAAQPSSSLTTPETVSVSLTVNGTRHALILDPESWFPPWHLASQRPLGGKLSSTAIRATSP